MLTKKDIAASVREEFGLTVSASVKLVDHVFDSVTSSIASGEGVSIRNLFTVSLKDRMSRNVEINGKKYSAKKYKAIVAKFSKNLRREANK